MTSGVVVGVVLLAAGVLISLAVLAHDLRRLRIALEVPQAAPSRMLPEYHALAATVSAAGAWVTWSWGVALLTLVVHVAVAFGVAPRIVERLAGH